MPQDYNREFLKELTRSGGHFWFSGRNGRILRAIKRHYPDLKLKALELGAGSGSVLFPLSRKGIDIDGCDIYPESVSRISQCAKMAFLYDVRRPPQEQGLERLKGVYDAVIMADVIEHLDEPVAALQNAGYFCKSGGMVVVTVPALRQLWSGYDIACGHKRRYTAEALKAEMEAAGLRCASADYFFITAAAILYLRRKASKARAMTDEDVVREEFRINPFLNIVFKAISGIESSMSLVFRMPFGSSLIAVGRRV